MKKTSLVVLAYLLLSFATPQPSHAWGGAGPGFIALVIAAAPFVLVYEGIHAVGHGIKKGIKGVKNNSKQRRLQAREEARLKEIEEHQKIVSFERSKFQELLRQFYSSIRTQMKNDHMLYVKGGVAKFDEENVMKQMIDFLDQFISNQDQMDPEKFLCAFRERFLKGLPQDVLLDPRDLAKLFMQYEKTGVIPEVFIEVSQKNLKISKLAAERIFSILYGTTLNMGVRLDDSIPDNARKVELAQG